MVFGIKNESKGVFMSQKKALLIDMGGVLVEIDWYDNVKKLLGQEFPRHEIHKYWISSPSVLAFESGRMSFSEFHLAINEEFNQSHDYDYFYSTFMSIILGPKKDVRAILLALQRRFTLGLLSNTSEIHIKTVQEKYGFIDVFDRLFLSYEMGSMKPEIDIYQQASDELKLKTEEIIFFDDGQINVDSAKSIGMDAYLVNSPQEIQSIIDNQYN